MLYFIGWMFVVFVVVGVLMLLFCSYVVILRVNVECLGGVQIYVDEGGLVYVDGCEVVLKCFSDIYYEVCDDRSGLKVLLSIGVDGLVQVFYIGRGGVNGVCQVIIVIGVMVLGYCYYDDVCCDDGDDDNLFNQVICELDDQWQMFCDMNMCGIVIVDCQFSYVCCVEGQIWGFLCYLVWVSGGCWVVFCNMFVFMCLFVVVGGGNVLVVCNVRKGEDGVLVIQVLVGECYMEVIVDYVDGCYLCMVGNDGMVFSLICMCQC